MHEPIKIPVEDARDMIWGEVDGYKVLSNEQFDSGRWMSYHELVIQDVKTRFIYLTTYQRGLTENQYCDPFEDEGEMVTFRPAISKTKTIVYYEEVK